MLRAMKVNGPEGGDAAGAACDSPGSFSGGRERALHAAHALYSLPALCNSWRHRKRFVRPRCACAVCAHSNSRISAGNAKTATAAAPLPHQQQDRAERVEWGGRVVPLDNRPVASRRQRTVVCVKTAGMSDRRSDNAGNYRPDRLRQ